jgi:hypothetical protein
MRMRGVSRRTYYFELFLVDNGFIRTKSTHTKIESSRFLTEMSGVPKQEVVKDAVKIIPMTISIPRNESMLTCDLYNNFALNSHFSHCGIHPLQRHQEQLKSSKARRKITKRLIRNLGVSTVVISLQDAL